MTTKDTDEVQNSIKLIIDKHVDAHKACKQYLEVEKNTRLNKTCIDRLIDAYMAIASTDDVQYAINLVNDKHNEALKASKQYLAAKKSSKFNFDAVEIRNLLNASDVGPKLDAYNITAKAFVDKFSGRSSNDANVCKTLYMISCEKNSATIAAAEFSKLLTMVQ